MLSLQQQTLAYQRAYIPEHLPEYVQSISGADAALPNGYLSYVVGDHLIFVGYPVADQCIAIEQAYEHALERFRPATVAIIAPSLSFHKGRFVEHTEDQYYKLELPLARLPSAVAYMIRRAAGELRVSEGAFGNDHELLIADFLAAREFDPAYKEIFLRIPEYLAQSRTALLLEGRKGDQLVAFTIVDFGSANYAFYLFNFRSLTAGVPGASDLLLYEMIRVAEAKGKSAINLGLGINPGVRRFKEKWGATPFLPYAYAMIRRSKGLLRILTGF